MENYFLAERFWVWIGDGNHSCSPQSWSMPHWEDDIYKPDPLRFQILNMSPCHRPGQRDSCVWQQVSPKLHRSWKRRRPNAVWISGEQSLQAPIETSATHRIIEIGPSFWWDRDCHHFRQPLDKRERQIVSFMLYYSSTIRRGHTLTKWKYFLWLSWIRGVLGSNSDGNRQYSNLANSCCLTVLDQYFVDLESMFTTNDWRATDRAMKKPEQAEPRKRT